MRVLQIIPDFGPGGAQRMAVHLMKCLDRERFESAAISLFDPVGTDLDEILADSGLPVWYLGKRKGFEPRMFVAIDKILRHFRPHVIHTHQYVLRYVWPLALYHRIPATIHTLHNPAEREVGRSGRLLHRIAFSGGVVPVAIAEEVASSMRRVYGVSKPVFIPNGIPTEVYRRPRTDREEWREREYFSARDQLLVCVARLDPQKNHALLLEAFARGFASDPRVHLLLVGKGKLKGELERQADKLGVRQRVRFLGVRRDVPDILNASDVFVMASDWEGNPLSVMEAMAAGRAVISTAVGGVPELVVDDVTGLLVPQGAVEGLTGAMKRLLEDTNKRESMERASVKRAQKLFDVRVMARAYEDLYDATVVKN